MNSITNYHDSISDYNSGKNQSDYDNRVRTGRVLFFTIYAVNFRLMFTPVTWNRISYFGRPRAQPRTMRLLFHFLKEQSAPLSPRRNSP